jgi:hypothetical protein
MIMPGEPEFEDAEDGWKQATALFHMLHGFWEVGAFPAIVNALRYEMEWYDWAIGGIAFIAQVIAWLATDRVAAGSSGTATTTTLAAAKPSLRRRSCADVDERYLSRTRHRVSS